MLIVAKSNLSTSNITHASYLLHSGDLNFLLTAPYSPSIVTIENLYLTLSLLQFLLLITKLAAISLPNMALLLELLQLK